MTEAQKKLREAREAKSKNRQRLAEIGVMAEADVTEEIRSEQDKLESAIPDLERRERAAQAAVDAEETEQREAGADKEQPDAEMRERIELRSKASLTNFLTAAMSGQQVTGAEAELRAAAGLTEGIPLELWDVAQPAQRRETRADVPTDAPDTVGVNLQPLQPMLFANSIAPRLGIEMPRVESGTFSTGTITTSLAAGAEAKDGAAESSEVQFTVASATPKRVSARLSIRLEDIAAVGAGNFESVLREHLAMRLSDELDRQAINGNGTGANLNGILKRLGDPTAPGAVANFDAYAQAHAEGVDGLWANTIKDVSVVVGPDTYQHASRTFQSTDGSKGELSAAAYAMNNTGGFWTNKRMPAKSGTNIQDAILYRMGRTMAGGGGAIRTAVCPHWNMVTIDDIYSDAAKGIRHFTAHVILGDVILVQVDAYKQVAFKLAD